MAQSPFNDREFARQAGIKSGVLRRERAQRRADAAESVSAVIAALAAEPHKHETISVSVSPDGMISVSATPAERRERQAEIGRAHV